MYSIVGIIAIIIHLIQNHDFFARRYDRTVKAKRVYEGFMYTTLAYYLVDVFWGIAALVCKNPVMVYISTIVYFVMMALTISACCQYVTVYLDLSAKIKRVITAAGFLIMVLGFVVLVVNHFTQFCFWVDADAVYHRESGRYLIYCSQAFLCFCLAILTGITSLKIDQGRRRRYVTIFLFCIDVIIVSLLQIHFPLYPVYTIGLMIGTCIIHTFVTEGERREYREELEQKQKILEENALSHTAQIMEIAKLNNRLQSNKIELQDALKNSEAANEDLKKQNTVIQTLAQQFNAIYYIDMKDHSYVELSTTVMAVSEVIEKAGNADDSFELMFKHLVFPEFVDEMRRFCDLKTIDERMAGKVWIAHEFSGPANGWSEGCFIASDRDEAGNLLHVIWGTRDINDRKKVQLNFQRDLQAAKEQAEAANHAKTVFLNNMSHDIRTPMNAILGYARLIEGKKDNPDQIIDYLNKIEKSGEYLLNIINNILEVSKIDSGKETVDEQFVDLYDESNNVAPLLESEFKRKNLSFSNNINIIHRYVYADMNKIREITMNLLSNAIKYTPEGGRISLTFEEFPSQYEGYATYVNTVSDNGIGMNPDFIEHIFDSFSRERNTTESKIIGTGLGMSIVKKLVDLMHGRIEVESEPDKGTTFRIIIDHQIVENPEKYLENRSVLQIKNFSIEGKKILLAEDNDFNAEIAIEILKNEGALVDRAEDGLKCVEKLEQAEDGYYDFILMDIQMPNLNGYDATRRIRKMSNELKASIPIFAMTANAFEEDRKNAFAAGMNEHIAKPINVETMLKTISEVISI